MSVDKLTLTKSWRDANDFPTYESSEAKVRDDMQCLFDEITTYINETLTAAVDTAVANALSKTAGAENALTGNLYILKDLPHLILVDTPAEGETGTDVHGEIGLGNDNKLRINIHEAGAAGVGGLVFDPNPRSGDINTAIQLWENVSGSDPLFWTFLTNRNVPAVSQMICGAYVGDGTYGAGTSTGLPTAVPFTPKLLMLWDSSGAVQLVHPIIPGTTQTYKLDGVTNLGTVNYNSELPNTISWMHADSAACQLNDKGVTYYYLVLGTAEV